MTFFFFLTLRTIWVHRLWLPLQFVKWLLWLWYWILLHSNPGCEVRNITGPTLSMRKWSSGTGLRPPSWNKSFTTGPAGQVDNTAAFDLYFNSSLYILTFWSVIYHTIPTLHSKLLIANNFKGSIAFIVEDKIGKYYWEIKACASADLQVNYPYS